MPEFRIHDPDGNRLWIGQSVSKPAQGAGTPVIGAARLHFDPES
jgi:hypothetical protein